MRELPKIARERLAAGPVSTPHLDPNLISAFVEHSLLPGERQRVIGHMALCEQCRTEVQLVISAIRPEAHDAESVRDLMIESRSGSGGFFWQRLLRWQPLTAAAAVAAISFGFWVATRQPASHGGHPAAPAPVTMASKAAAPPIPTAGAGSADARLQAAAPPAEAKQALTITLGNSKASVIAPKSVEVRDTRRSELADQLVSGKAQSPMLLQAEARRQKAIVLAPPPPAPPPPAPAANAPLAQPARAAAGQPAATQDAAVSAESQAAPARGVASAPPAFSLRENFAAQSAMAPRLAAKRALGPVARWAAITDATASQGNQGSVEKSLDGGRTWQRVPVADGVTFRVVYASGRDVWAGGAAGAFFHSNDRGEHWSAVPLVMGNGAATGDIVSIQFADAAHGVVSASSGQSWTTSDGGQHWQQAQ